MTYNLDKYIASFPEEQQRRVRETELIIDKAREEGVFLSGKRVTEWPKRWRKELERRLE